MTKTIVAGVGMIKFAKPGASDNYDKMGADAIRAALADSGLSYDDIQQAYAGYVYGDSTCGQKALYHVGMTGIPVINVNNNCSTGSTALFLARQAIEHGIADCVLAVGFEQMQRGALQSHWTDRPTPFDDFDHETDVLVGNSQVPLALRYFGGAGKSHMENTAQSCGICQNPRQGLAPCSQQPPCPFQHRSQRRRGDECPSVWDGVMTRLMACPRPVAARRRSCARKTLRRSTTSRPPCQSPVRR